MVTDQDILNEFISECEEHLLSVEDDLLRLEHTDPGTDGVLVGSLFRVMHSIKGGAGFLGMTAISSLAHDLESVLSLIRDGELAPARDVVDALLAGTDQLKLMLTDANAVSDHEAGAMRRSLAAYLDGAREPAPAAPTAPTAETAPEPAPARADTPAEAPIPVAENHAAPEAPEPESRPAAPSNGSAEGGQLFRLVYERPGIPPEELAAERDAILARLGQECTVQESRVEPEDGESPQRLVVTVQTWLEPDFLCVLAGLPEDRIERPPAPAGPTLPATQGDPAATPASATPTADAAAGPTASTAALPAGAPPADSAGTGEPGRGTSADPSAPAPDAGAAGDGSSPPPPAVPGMGPAEITETVRINVGIIDTLMNLAGELVSLRNQFLRKAQKQDPTMRTLAHGLDTVTSHLQETIMTTRMQPIGKVFGRLPRLVREISRTLQKEVHLELVGNDVELDKTILEALVDPLAHLIRNSCDHGIELPAERQRKGKPTTGEILVRAYHEGGQINIEIRDDGAGIDVEKVKAKARERGLKTAAELERMTDQDAYALLFQPGFSTAAALSEVSGRGVGLDVVKTALASVGGEIEVHATPGEGTAFLLRLPLTLAIMPCLVVGVLGDRFAIPQVNVEELVCLYGDQIGKQIEYSVDREVFHLRDRLVQLAHLKDILTNPEPFTRELRAELTERHRHQYAGNGNGGGAAASADDPAPGGETATAGLLQSAAEGAEGDSARRLYIVLLRVGSTIFGMVVDEIHGNEEIVVKPMHGNLKHLTCFSGATVMGDAETVLILDVHGMAKHVGVELIENDRDSAREQVVSTVDHSMHLLFDADADQQFAVPLQDIKRIVRVEAADIHRTDQGYMTEIDGRVTRAHSLDPQRIAGIIERGEPLHLLLSNGGDAAQGMLVGNLVDIVTPHAEITPAHDEKLALVGAAMVAERMTLFIDLPAFLARFGDGEKLASWAA